MRDLEKEFADEIYIFTSKDKPGIMFYDRSPEPVVQKFTGELPEHKYHTDRHSIVPEVKWDEQINEPNSVKRVRYYDGSNDVTTYMVSEEAMKEIQEEIQKSIREKTEPIIIDLRKYVKEKKEKVSENRNDFKRQIVEADKENLIDSLDMRNLNNVKDKLDKEELLEKNKYNDIRDFDE